MKRIFVTGLAFVLAIVASITGTLAWLTANTEAVTNTFTVGDINITLIEHKYDESDSTKITSTEISANLNNYDLIPGKKYAKDPTVTVKANSEKCYLFVKFEEKNSPSTYLVYESNLNADNQWTQGDGTNIPNDVWYRIVDESTTDVRFELLKQTTATDDNQTTVIVRDNIVKTKKDTETGVVVMPTSAPSLVYTAYAIQYESFADNPTGAWKAISNPNYTSYDNTFAQTNSENN